MTQEEEQDPAKAGFADLINALDASAQRARASLEAYSQLSSAILVKPSYLRIDLVDTRTDSIIGSADMEKLDESLTEEEMKSLRDSLTSITSEIAGETIKSLTAAKQHAELALQQASAFNPGG